MDSVITGAVVIACLGFGGGYIGWLIDSALEPYEPPPPRTPRRPELVPDPVTGIVAGSGYNRAPKARVSGPLEHDDPGTTVLLVCPRAPELRSPYTQIPAAGPGPGWNDPWGLPQVPSWDPEQTQPTPMIYDMEHR